MLFLSTLLYGAYHGHADGQNAECVYSVYTQAWGALTLSFCQSALQRCTEFRTQRLLFRKPAEESSNVVTNGVKEQAFHGVHKKGEEERYGRKKAIREGKSKKNEFF